MFETRRQQRQQDLYNLVNYAKSDAGLRRQLLDHFGDDAQSNDDAESVGVVDWHPEKLALVATEAPTELAGVTDWRTQVAKLFNLG